MRKKIAFPPLVSKSEQAGAFLALIFTAAVFLPLLRMFAGLDVTGFRRVLADPGLQQALRNSLLTALPATAITVTAAFLLSLCVHRTGIPGKGIFGILFVLPMLLPSISHGMGLILLLGNNGILTRLFGWRGSIYGMPGILLGSVLYAFPVAWLMLGDVLAYEDGAAHQAARVLGVSRFRAFTTLTLTFLRRPLRSTCFTVFAMIVTDYGVPLMVGGKYTTLAVVMYQEVIGRLDFGKGAVCGALLLLPAVAAFLLDLNNRDKGRLAQVSESFPLLTGRSVQTVAFLCCVVVSVLVLLPPVAFLLQAFAADYPADLTPTLAHLARTFRLRGGVYYGNSLLISLGTAFIGTAVAFLTAYLSTRMHSRLSRFLHLSALTTAAIPGMVLGLSYVLVFRNTPFYGTIALLILVNMVHFIASPYLMICHALSKTDENLEGVAHTLGIRRGLLIRHVLIPHCKSTLLEMFSYFFVNSMMTISAVSFLATTQNKPLSLMINQFEAQMQLECAAVVSLLILLTNLTVKGTAHFLRCKKGEKR